MERPYVPTPFTFFTPSLPSLERHIVPRTPANPLLLLLACLRFAWVLATLPLHALLVLLSLLAPTLPIPVKGRNRKQWNLGQRILYPTISRVLWSIPGTGALPLDISAETERQVPFMSRWIQRFMEVKVNVRVDDVVLPKAATDWIVGEAVDPRDEVRVGVVPCFWLEVEGKGGQARLAKDGERVILFLVGGGYVAGNPTTGSRCFDLARETGLRIMGANYRKATSSKRAFPAALQDAVVAYAHLVLDLGYTDIVLGGDSAGAGLAVCLLLYLTSTLCTSETPPANLVLPSALILYSPWVDLTLSNYFPKIPADLVDDFLNPTQLNAAVNGYLVNTFHRRTDAPQLGMSTTEFKRSPYNLGASHPLFSPALASSLPTIQTIPTAYAKRSQPRPRVLMFSGTAELFAPEIRMLGKNFDAAGVDVDLVEEVDELHAYILVPRWLSPAVARSLARVGKFLIE